MVEQIGRCYSLLFQRGLVYSGDLPRRDQQAVGEVSCRRCRYERIDFRCRDLGPRVVPFDLDSRPFFVPSLRNQIYASRANHLIAICSQIYWRTRKMSPGTTWPPAQIPFLFRYYQVEDLQAIYLSYSDGVRCLFPQMYFT